MDNRLLTQLQAEVRAASQDAFIAKHGEYAYGDLATTVADALDAGNVESEWQQVDAAMLASGDPIGVMAQWATEALGWRNPGRAMTDERAARSTPEMQGPLPAGPVPIETILAT